MDYKNGKIYKVQFDDGHFYIGSTAGSLRQRWNTHKRTISVCSSSCSKHIAEVGVDACRIVLIENYPCESKDHLRRKEDEHIQLHREDPLCLNIRRAYNPEYNAEWRATHREHEKAQQKLWRDAHKEEIKIRNKEYRAKNV